MRGLCIIAICLFSFIGTSAQENLSKEEKARREKNIQAGNPFKQFGYKGKVATLSKGKYLEVHDLDSIVTIGSIRFHVDTKKIVGSVLTDTTSLQYARPIGDIASRWLSPDPLSEEFTSWSPYNFCYDNPIKFKDPDGRAAIASDNDFEPTKEGNLKVEKGDTPEKLKKEYGLVLKTGKDQNGGKFDFKEGDVLVLDNNMTRDVAQYNKTGEIETESCHEAAYSAVKGLEINQNTAEVHSSLDGIVEGLSSDAATDFAKGYTKASSSSDATFGKTITVFGDGAHSAVFYGTSNNGTNYYYSKNGNGGPPTISKESDLVSQYGAATYYNPNTKK